MKLLVCGSRDMPSYMQSAVQQFIKEIGPTEVIHGAARGADTLAKISANKLNIKETAFPADWGKHGKVAGPIRNQLMLDEKPDMVLAFYPSTGITSGTADMVNRAKKAGVAVKLIEYEQV